MQNETRAAAYELLDRIVRQLETDLIQRWRASDTTEARESAWHAQRQLELIAGAIEDGLREFSDDK